MAEKKEKKVVDQTKAWIVVKKAMEIDPLIADDVVNGSNVAALTKILETRLRSRSNHRQRSVALRATPERYIAMGHAFFKPKSWTSNGADSEIGVLGSEKNTNFLKALLITGWTQVKAIEIVLVDEPDIPQLYRRSLVKLGGVTVQRTALESETRSRDELIEAAGVLTAAECRSTAARKAATRGAHVPPAPISGELVTKEIDVCFEMTYDRRGGGHLVRLEWCPGVIIEFSPAVEEGTKKKKAKAIAVIKYTDGTDGTLAVNRPTFWNAKKAGGWRIHVEDDEDDDDSENEETDESGLVDHVNDEIEEDDDENM